ncbi:hypothetical protein KYJ98_01295 [Mammaliicoccus lentus]|uniref:hypothetical protein n=1 Tax=Mammaliicoccus lentus TaxID=42858 RepID=UPI001C4E1B89|nr:hypothetical protein [Mammaliicoccus lentus]MBW0768972.1 hypothetical protein [Mammaliicoccus lentus]
MSTITKVLAGLAVIAFIIGVVMEISGDSGIKFTIASILFLIAAFINRNSDRNKQSHKK